MKSTITCLVLIAFLCGSMATVAQQEGDYRSISSGKSTKKQIWQVYSGSQWENAKNALGNQSANTVTIRNGHTVEYNTQGGSIKNLIVEEGAKFYRNSSSSNKTLNLYGDIVCNGTIGNGSTTDRINVLLHGSSTTISGNGDCRVYQMFKAGTGLQTELTIDGLVELYRNSGTSLYNDVEGTVLKIVVEPNAILTVNSSIDLNAGTVKVATLTVRSDETGHGSLVTPSVLHSDDSNTLVERYLSEGMWHYVCPPVKNETANVFYDIYFISFNEPDGTWTYITDPGELLSNSIQGYGAWAAPDLTGDATLEFKGEIKTGAFEMGLTRTSEAGHNHKGYNFVGNPYSTAIDWDYTGPNGWDKTNVDDAIYMWKAEEGVYGSYIDGIITNNVNNIIPAHQAFFVHCNNDEGNLGMDHGVQVGQHAPFLKNGNGTDMIFKLFAEGEGLTDETVVRFTQESTIKFDSKKDAYKMFGYGDAPQLYSILEDGHELSISSMPATGETMKVALGFKANNSGLYTISGKLLKGINPYNLVILEDLISGEKIQLTEEVEYTFVHETGAEAHRFNLVFTSKNAVKNLVPETSNQEMSIYSYGNKVHILNAEQKPASIEIFNLMGQKVLETESAQIHTTLVLEKRGYFIVKTYTGENMKTAKVYIE